MKVKKRKKGHPLKGILFQQYLDIWTEKAINQVLVWRHLLWYKREKEVDE
jgi:hypothetical protein